MTRTLKDYARHRDSCASHRCRRCSTGQIDHRWESCHVYHQGDCSCGLDALLAECAPAAPPEHDWMDNADPRMARWPSIRSSTPDGMKMCFVCGVIKRLDGENKPCKGQMPKIELRAAPPETTEPLCICDRVAHPNDCPVHRDYQPAPETTEPEERLNYANPEVLRSGLLHLRVRIEENLDAPHYRDYHLEVIDEALKLVPSAPPSAQSPSDVIDRYKALIQKLWDTAGQFPGDQWRLVNQVRDPIHTFTVAEAALSRPQPSDVLARPELIAAIGEMDYALGQLLFDRDSAKLDAYIAAKDAAFTLAVTLAQEQT